MLKSWAFRSAKTADCTNLTAAPYGERGRQHPLSFEMYDVDSECTQAQRSVLMDMTITSVGLSFC